MIYSTSRKADHKIIADKLDDVLRASAEAVDDDGEELAGFFVVQGQLKHLRALVDSLRDPKHL